MGSDRIVRLATRASALALWQARHAADLIRATGLVSRVDIIKFTTAPDRDPSKPLHEMGDKGLFVKEIEDALLAGNADAGVHSLKDLPSELLDGLGLAAVPERDDPRDALLSKHGATLKDLPNNAVVATSSLRRRGQLLRVRPDLRVVALRGNVETRVRKLRDGEFDAMVLAVAGLRRLGLEDEIAEFLPLETILPAAAQGALGIEVSTDSEFADVWRAVDNQDLRLCAEAEREFIRRIGADCKTPVACLCELTGGVMRLRAMVCSPDGGQYLSSDLTGDAEDSLALAQGAASDLQARGALEIIVRARLEF